MKKLSSALLIFLLLGPAMFFTPASQGCVGKKIIIGTLAEPEQKILANLLALLIRERTGTSVEIQVFSKMEELRAALREEKIQIYNEYLVTGVHNLNLAATANNEEILKELKKEFNQRFNLIWLEPYGFLNSRVNHEARLSAAPLIDKQTLKLFPALPRLLNKLGGKLTDEQLTRLLSKLEEKKLAEEDVAREFLKQEKLI